ncbi:hypothetical protein FGO68_gene6675 [Halteria grandinella]|uniref:type I protein arginine methyltransferase n=1 Tax=Halteria grandinella TaxID=5974 RepID=A0A8J8T381_HALGN|nr:hypothetical protein FGO68_gene6675 [Halteria grandinella]
MIFSTDTYFRSYEKIHSHRIMLMDESRTFAYKNALEQNSSFLQDKIVLDIGAGTGILSIFAARAGAKHVYAIEFSQTAELARKIIAENELSDRITVIQKRVEDVELGKDLPEKVDAIVSEWMGFCLLYESMLDSVIDARNRLLKPDGLMFPERARIYIAGLDDTSYKFKEDQLWVNNKYGVKMESVKKELHRYMFADLLLDTKSIVTTPCKVLDLNLKTCTVSDLEFSSSYEVKTYETEQLGYQEYDFHYLNAMMMWFDVQFPNAIDTTDERPLDEERSRQQIVLSTSPYCERTHWKQQIMYLSDPEIIYVKENSKIRGSFALRKNPSDERDIQLKLSVHAEKVKDGTPFSKEYFYIFT